MSRGSRLLTATEVYDFPVGIISPVDQSKIEVSYGQFVTRTGGEGGYEVEGTQGGEGRDGAGRMCFAGGASAE